MWGPGVSGRRITRLKGGGKELLVSALAKHNCERRAQQNFYIHPERPGTCIFEVQPNHLVKLYAAAPSNLPESSDAWFGFNKSPAMPQIIGLYLIGKRWTRPNQRHLPFENIDELRQFIHTRSAQKRANRSDTGIPG